MRRACHAVILAAIAASGCATGEKRAALDEEFARMNESERLQACTRFFRDVKFSCRDGLQDESASQSYECLSARMKLDRHCLTPR